MRAVETRPLSNIFSAAGMAAAAAACAMLAGCAVNTVSGHSELVLMSEAQELSLGRRADQDVKKQHALYDHKGLRQTVRSFRALGAGERKLARQLTLRLVKADASTRFAALARSSPLGGAAEGWLRMVNAMYPSGEPSQGQALKIIE